MRHREMAQNLDLRCVLISDPSTLGAGAKTRLHAPKAVAYHAQPHYCRFMIGHSLGRMESRLKKCTPHCICRPRKSRAVSEVGTRAARTRTSSGDAGVVPRGGRTSTISAGQSWKPGTQHCAWRSARGKAARRTRCTRCVCAPHPTRTRARSVPCREGALSWPCPHASTTCGRRYH